MARVVTSKAATATKVPCVSPHLPHATGCSRPCLVPDNGGYVQWTKRQLLHTGRPHAPTSGPSPRRAPAAAASQRPSRPTPSAAVRPRPLRRAPAGRRRPPRSRRRRCRCRWPRGGHRRPPRAAPLRRPRPAPAPPRRRSAMAVPAEPARLTRPRTSASIRRMSALRDTRPPLARQARLPMQCIRRV